MSKLHFSLVRGKWGVYQDRCHAQWGLPVTIGDTIDEAWREYKAYKGLE